MEKILAQGKAQKENKMKKSITVLIVLAVMTAGVFATDPSIVLTTAVSPVTRCGFTTSTVNSFTQSVTDFTGDVAVGDINGYKVYYQSNEKKTIKLSLSGTPFISQSTGSKMGYSLVIGDRTLTTSTGVASTSVDVMSIYNNTGATGQSYNFSGFAIKTNDELVAVAATDYRSTLTLTVSAT